MRRTEIRIENTINCPSAEQAHKHLPNAPKAARREYRREGRRRGPCDSGKGINCDIHKGDLQSAAREANGKRETSRCPKNDPAVLPSSNEQKTQKTHA
jgi:hypothetical protein